MEWWKMMHGRLVDHGWSAWLFEKARMSAKARSLASYSIIPGFCQLDITSMVCFVEVAEWDWTDRGFIRSQWFAECAQQAGTIGSWVMSTIPEHAWKSATLDSLCCEMPTPCKAIGDLKNNTAPFFDLVRTLLNNRKSQCHKTRRLKKPRETSIGSVVWRVTITVSS